MELTRKKGNRGWNPSMFSGKYKQESFCTDFDVDFVFVHFILKYAKQNEHVGGIATRNRKARLVNYVVFFLCGNALFLCAQG